MNTPTTDQIEVQPAQNVGRLLYFFELSQQALEVKLDCLVAYPEFLEAAVGRIRNKKSLNELVGVGKLIVRHAAVLRRIILDLGGTPEQEFSADSPLQTNEPIATFSFHETMAARIVEEILQVVMLGWPNTDKRRWILEQLETVRHETLATLTLLDRLFAKTESRYRDLVLDQFRAQALS